MTIPTELIPAASQWAQWLESYGAGRFVAAFLEQCQGVEANCKHCGEKIYLDILDGGGVPDWGVDGDFGCPDSPWTNDEGTGGHEPVKRR